MQIICICVIFFSVIVYVSSSSNFSCYQCVRPTEDECGLEDLKPCSSSYDRCAIHVTKSKAGGLEVRRECGLAPCLFDDEMAAMGLGMHCDRNKDEYMCTSCCKGNGCNKNADPATTACILLLITAVSLICLINFGEDAYITILIVSIFTSIGTVINMTRVWSKIRTHKFRFRLDMSRYRSR